MPICEPIDDLLNGGIEYSCVNNFYGASASGKTNIALEALVSCINQGKKCIYIDTEGGFSLERLKQIAGDTKKYTDNTILIEPKTWKEQIDAFRKLNEMTAGLIIVDSIVALWRITITDENVHETIRELGTQLSILSKIAREKKIPALITNQVYSDVETGKTEMSAKNIIKWWSKNIIELKHTGRTSQRIARIIKARSLPEHKRILFSITQSGLKKEEYDYNTVISKNL
jgi:DNA repair protein RadB